MNFLKALFGVKEENSEEKRLADEQKNFDILKYDGVKALKTGQWQQAIRCLNHALNIREDLECRDYLSQALLQNNELTASYEQLQLLHEAEPENEDILLRMAQVAFLMEDYGAMASACEKWLLLSKENPEVYYLYGRACMGQEDITNAIAMFTRAIAQNENYADAYLMRAHLLLENGETDEAEKDCQWLMERADDVEDVLILKAQVEIAKGKYDEALSWYNALKPYVDWGCTHQLAGSFDSYANFFKKVRDDGNYGYADELHNVGEAMVGVEYGMQAGVWWGFDSRARGEFCRISNTGSRIGYGENRAKWTAACVYRDDETPIAKAFIGSSERQANTSTFGFVSTDREVYYDGQGPLRAFTMEIPGGTGYQQGQTNAERVIDITYGEDVPPSAITPGVYKIVNFATKSVAAVNGTADGQTNVSQMKWTNAKAQQWNIEFVSQRIGGDYSFYKITNVMNGRYMNVLNNSTAPANIISFNAGCAPNEQWYLEYAGNGYYYIRNRLSALYLEVIEKSSSNGVNIRQNRKATTDAARQLQMWRILPIDVDYETNAPAQPQGLTAEGRQAAVKLSWTANTEEDLAGYMVLRAEKGTDQWNTIARKLTSTEYVDNTCRQGVAYDYRVKAIDKAENQSECSETASAETSGAKGLVAHWEFEDTLIDATENYFDAIHGATPVYVTERAVGEKALVMNGTTDFVQLPYEIADMDEMTISLWAYWTNPSSTNVRIFDFGNGPTQYMYLTPQNGKGICFGIKNGGSEQQLTYGRRLGTRAWKHLVVTLGTGGASLYMDGEEIAHSDEVTIKPSDIRASLNYLGRGQTASAAKFRGNIDDVRIFNYALSADEVKALTEEAISGIEQQETYAPTVGADALYDLQGRRIHRAGQRGIVIQRSDDGTAKKVVVN